MWYVCVCMVGVHMCELSYFVEYISLVLLSVLTHHTTRTTLYVHATHSLPHALHLLFHTHYTHHTARTTLTIRPYPTYHMHICTQCPMGNWWQDTINYISSNRDLAYALMAKLRYVVSLHSIASLLNFIPCSCIFLPSYLTYLPSFLPSYAYFIAP